VGAGQRYRLQRGMNAFLCLESSRREGPDGSPPCMAAPTPDGGLRWNGAGSTQRGRDRGRRAAGSGRLLPGHATQWEAASRGLAAAAATRHIVVDEARAMTVAVFGVCWLANTCSS
jgi:hypothetical protein